MLSRAPTGGPTSPPTAAASAAASSSAAAASAAATARTHVQVDASEEERAQASWYVVDIRSLRFDRASLLIFIYRDN